MSASEKKKIPLEELEQMLVELHGRFAFEEVWTYKGERYVIIDFCFNVEGQEAHVIYSRADRPFFGRTRFSRSWADFQNKFEREAA